jgi:hypothetical protein
MRPGASLVSSQYLGVRAGLAPAQAGNRKGLPLLFEKMLLSFYGVIRQPRAFARKHYRDSLLASG